MFKEIITIILVLPLLLGACDMKKEDAGTVGGALLGAVAGAQFGKGDGQLVGVAVGTLAGAAIGNSIGKSLDKADRMYYDNAYQTTLETAPTGHTSSWKNPDSGNRGSFTPTKTYQSHGEYCREFTQTVVISGKSQKAYGTACRQADGSWKIQG